MMRRARWCLPLALSLAACQAPPVPSSVPEAHVPADAPSGSVVYQLPPSGEPASEAAESGATATLAWMPGRSEPYPTPGAAPAWHPGSGGFSEPYPTPEPEAGEPYPAPGANWGGGGASSYYPDLVAIAPSSFYVDTREAGKRILRFPTAIGNGGPGHLQIRGRVEGNVTRGTQEILDGSGRVIETRDVGTFELHPDHGHFHVSHVARYELRRDTYDGEFVQNGKKISFCMEDSIRIREGSDEARIPECNQTMQGITRGFADVYSANLPDQTFDFTALASGQYVIVIHLDPGRKFLETNRNNNLAWVKFRYDAAAGKAYRLASYP